MQIHTAMFVVQVIVGLMLILNIIHHW